MPFQMYDGGYNDFKNDPIAKSDPVFTPKTPKPIYDELGKLELNSTGILSLLFDQNYDIYNDRKFLNEMYGVSGYNQQLNQYYETQKLQTEFGKDESLLSVLQSALNYESLMTKGMKQNKSVSVMKPTSINEAMTSALRSAYGEYANKMGNVVSDDAKRVQELQQGINKMLESEITNNNNMLDDIAQYVLRMFDSEKQSDKDILDMMGWRDDQGNPVFNTKYDVIGMLKPGEDGKISEQGRLMMSYLLTRDSGGDTTFDEFMFNSKSGEFYAANNGKSNLLQYFDAQNSYTQSEISNYFKQKQYDRDVAAERSVWENTPESQGGGKKEKDDKCITEYSMITMANGKLKRCDKVKMFDKVKVNGGTSRVLFVYKHERKLHDVMRLTFENTTVDIVGQHAFYDLTIQKWVDFEVKGDVSKFINHYFEDDRGSSRKLISAEVIQVVVTPMAIVTMKNLCCYTDGMLSMASQVMDIKNAQRFDKKNTYTAKDARSIGVNRLFYWFIGGKYIDKDKISLEYLQDLYNKYKYKQF